MLQNKIKELTANSYGFYTISKKNYFQNSQNHELWIPIIDP